MPNIKKLVAGDIVYAGEDCLTVTLVDPIQLFIKATGADGTTSEYRPWQLLSSRPPVKNTEEKRRKRKKNIKLEDKKLETPEENEDIMQDCKDIEESFFFKLVLRGDGLLVQVGDVYCVSHLGSDTPFVVTNIIGNRKLKFNVELTLVILVNDTIKDIVSNFKLSLDIKFINRELSYKKSSKFSIFVNNLMCNAKSKMSSELLKNDCWYRSQCRTFFIGSQLRASITSNINVMARSSTVNLGNADMSVDPSLFNLSECNKYRVSFSIQKFCELDKIMGSKWDIKPQTKGVPDCYFYFVNKVVICIDKQDQLKVKFTYARSTFPVCENYRERIVESNVVHSNVLECPTSDSVANLSL